MENIGFQGYDIFVLVLIVGMTIFGGMKGLAWQIAQSASFLVSWKVAVAMSPSLAPAIGADKPWDRIIAMLILFIATSLVVWVAFRFVSKLIERVQLKEFDRQMGAILGLINGLLICMAITFFGVMLSDRTRSLVLSSHCGYYSAKMIQRATPLLPEDVRNALETQIDEFNARVNAQDVERPAEAAATPSDEEPPTSPLGNDDDPPSGTSDPWGLPEENASGDEPPPSIWETWDAIRQQADGQE